MKAKWITGALCALSLSLAIPALTSEKVDDGKAQERIQTELSAMKERPAQTKCPMSGRPVAEGKGYTYMGYRIGTCCDNCAANVEKDPLTAIMKMRAAGEEPQLAEGFAHQTRCPMSGKPIAAEHFKVKNNALVTFCCPGCPGGYEKDAEGVMGKLLESKQAPILITLAQTTCPVSGHPINEEQTVAVEGKIIKICCEGCKSPISENPAKFLQALADEGIVLENAK